MGYDMAHVFLDKLEDMLLFLVPNYVLEGKNQLVVAIGCTGGKHRSVTLANKLYERLQKQADYGVRLEHRDIGKDAARESEDKMSFSGEIKEELSTLVPAAHHCRLAETAAILLFCGKIILTETDSCCVKIQTENLPVARKYFTLLRKTFNMRAEVSVRKSREIRYYSIVIRVIRMREGFLPARI